MSEIFETDEMRADRVAALELQVEGLEFEISVESAKRQGPRRARFIAQLQCELKGARRIAEEAAKPPAYFYMENRDVFHGPYLPPPEYVPELKLVTRKRLGTDWLMLRSLVGIFVRDLWAYARGKYV